MVMVVAPVKCSYITTYMYVHTCNTVTSCPVASQYFNVYSLYCCSHTQS